MDDYNNWFNPHFWDSDGDGGSQFYSSLKQAEMDYCCRPVIAAKGIYSLHRSLNDSRIVGILVKRY